MARPRDPDVDRKIINATRELIARDGYAALNLTTVAQVAGIGKPALYRRYSSKAELVFAATVDASIQPDIPDTGSFEEDIRIIVVNLIASLKLPPREALGDRIGHAIADAAFRVKVNEVYHGPALERVMAIWDRAVARGEVDPSLDGERAMRDLSSTVVMQILYYDDVDEEHFTNELITRVVRGVGPTRPKRRKS